MAVNIVNPDGNRAIVNEDLTMHEVYREIIRQLIVEVNGRSLIFGIGSPEGVVNASKGAEYMDEIGVTSAIKYIKKLSDIAGNTSLGWILI